MDGVFGSYLGRFKKPQSVIDNVTFRLHYRISFGILLACSALVTSFQYFGNAIDCMQKGVSGGMMNTYCWIHGTFTIPSRLTGELGVNMPHPGVGPTTDPNLIKVLPNGDEVRHGWYQWVCFVLVGQAFLFYLPHYLWKSWEGNKISLMSKGLDSLLNEKPATKAEERETSVNYFDDHLNGHGLYVTKYIFCEVLNMANVLCQIYFMNFFFGGQFFTYGWDVMRISELPMQERVDPMSKVFPKMTKCTFNKYGPSGTVEITDGLCLLAINIINEKVYVFLWFWFILLSGFTAVHLILRLVSIASPQFRFAYLKKRSSTTADKTLKYILRKCQYGDWWLLMQLSKTYHPLVFKDFLEDLEKKMINTEKEKALNAEFQQGQGFQLETILQK